jgi:general stress protein 26
MLFIKVSFMDSINKQQEEKNYQDLHGTKAGERIKEMAEKNNTCFFCTRIRTGEPLNVRPMSIQKMDEEGNFWFLSASDSYKNQEIEEDNLVHLLFQGSAQSDFLSIYGKSTISTDKKLIKELWDPMLKTWFTEGVDDPRITVIKVETKEGYYWDNKDVNAIAFLKMAAGAMLGKTIDDSIEGKLTV